MEIAERECFESIDFWDSELEGFEFRNNNLLITVELWNANIAIIEVFDVIFFEVNSGETGFRPFEVDDKDFIKLSVNQENINLDDIKFYCVKDISDNNYIKVIGSNITLKKLLHQKNYEE